ncbi:hypothetical protein PVAG01_03599 [Phlyctema vagabunda]|uniref:AHC1-like C2H2 zinc-finger domain-containing protein n=1 Tax=Phlyctema vagabunda TaxID=108571 RepID=A0ABR4PLW9_9HELO
MNGVEDQKMPAFQSPVVDSLPDAGAGAKRKRDLKENAPELATEGELEAKRCKTGATPQGESALQDVDPETSALRDTIESQFSLEILVKHNELRLINQELAKCQVALEQLRRCHLIPYPIAQRTPQAMLDISSGIGPASLPQRGATVPQWAPPYGVVDGPYTRHYAKWLIPDPSFDANCESYQSADTARVGKSLPEGRTTRHSFTDGSSLASKARVQRGSAGQKLQALSSGYPQAKEKAGPCVLKRSDGQMVKLVCLDCQRENFSSTQGFINHCRIAHRRDFKSHEEAAQQSGQAIEVDDVGGIVGEEKAPSIAPGLVHPLIRDTPVEKGAYKALLSRINASMALFNQGKLPGVTSIPGSAKSSARVSPSPNKSFVPSLATPHLSALMQSKGFGDNLNDIVGEAKKHVDLDDLLQQSEDSEDSDKSVKETHRRPLAMDGASDSPPVPAKRIPARAAVSPAPYARPTSSKGLDAARKPGISPRLAYTAPLINTTAEPYNKLAGNHRDLHSIHEVDHELMDMHGPSLVDLSPNTVASNNAPSLVSDDGEYDDGDDAESASEDEGRSDSDVAEISIADCEMEKVVPNSVGSGSKKDGKQHVTFVSAMQESGRGRK